MLAVWAEISGWMKTMICNTARAGVSTKLPVSPCAVSFLNQPSIDKHPVPEKHSDIEEL